MKSKFQEKGQSKKQWNFVNKVDVNKVQIVKQAERLLNWLCYPQVKVKD